MDDDPLLISLADALTCAFGAAIVLFLIFVVLVRFDPPAPVPTSGVHSSRSISASLANDTPGESSLVIFAESEVQNASCTNSSVFSLKVEDTDEDGVRNWSSETSVWDGAKQTATLCRKVFEIPAGVTRESQPLIVVNDTNLETIRFRVHVGANAWPDWGRFWHEPIQAADRPQPLLRITGETDNPVLTRQGGDL